MSYPVDYVYLDNLNNVAVPNLTVENFVRFTAGEVTQSTSPVSSVTCNSVIGVIDTVLLVNEPWESVTFHLLNTFIEPGSVVILNELFYAGIIGTDGCPHIKIQVVDEGSADVVVTNIHPTNALNGSVAIGFLVINSL